MILCYASPDWTNQHICMSCLSICVWVRVYSVCFICVAHTFEGLTHVDADIACVCFCSPLVLCLWFSPCVYAPFWILARFQTAPHLFLPLRCKRGFPTPPKIPFCNPQPNPTYFFTLIFILLVYPARQNFVSFQSGFEQIKSTEGYAERISKSFTQFLCNILLPWKG